MKILLFLLFPVFAFGQAFTYYEVINPIAVYKDKYDYTVVDSLHSGAVFTKIHEVTPNYYRIFYYESKDGYIKASTNAFKIIDQKDYKRKEDLHREKRLEKYENKETKTIELLDSIEYYENLIYKSLPKNKIFLFGSNITNDGLFSGLSLNFFSTFPKEVKYIEFTVQGFNRVKDPETAEKKLKLIGPIEWKSKLSHKFENVFSSDLLEEIKVKKITVTHFDNTTVSFLPENFTIKDKNILMHYLNILYLEIELLTNSIK